MFNLPNLLTLINLLCGSMGIIVICSGYPGQAWIWVALALAADFGDGLAARALKISSPIGKDLDSLADVISFGLLPAFMMYQLMRVSLQGPTAWQHVDLHYPALPAFFILLFSALRLAKFNSDTRQTEGFIGVPTPTNCGLMLGLFGTAWLHPSWASWYLSFYLLLVITLLSSWMLLAELPMVSNKISAFNFKDNKTRWLLLAIFVLSVAISGFLGLVVTYVFYVLFSLFQYFKNKE